MTRVLIVVPLKPGAKAKAAELLAGGPPFDPYELGLDRHQVHLTDEEAVFVFEGTAPDIVERLVESAPLWAAAEAWAEVVAGAPRLADDRYSWARPAGADELTYAPTPGPGDSEGGDIFAP